MIIQKKNPL